MSLIAAASAANKKHNLDLGALRALAEAAGSLPLRELVERFAIYDGFLFPELTSVIKQAITDACRRNNFVDPVTAVSKAGRVHADLLAKLDLRHITYLDEGPAEPETTARLLAACPNIHQSEELPQPISRRLALANVPALDFHTASDTTLYVGPFGFQLFDEAQGFYIPGATARQHTTTILSAPALIVGRPVVLIQDIFNGYNFAHFLLDWLTRLALFAMHGPIPSAECLFVMGGIPTEFHRIVLDAARTELGLDESNFYFPTADVLIRGAAAVGYFSGQCIDCGHPAQMCRPEAMAWIDRLAHAVPGAGDSGHRKLYISRGDVGRRAIVNEAELFASLETRGFLFVRLGDLPVADQLALMRSAETVVAPHGMGLTYLALHTGRARLVELHNPLEGTDTYAFLAKGKGFAYGAVIGEGIDGTSNFRIGVSEVGRALAVPPGPTLPKRERRAVVMDPRSQNWHAGCQLVAASVTADVPPPLPGLMVIRHARNAAAQIRDSNIGWWQLEVLQPLQTYTLSCLVYLPEVFAGDRVTLNVGEPRAHSVAADLSRRNEWQRLSITLTLGQEVPTTNLVLRASAAIDTVLYSAGWRVDQAPFAALSHVADAPVAAASSQRRSAPAAPQRYVLHVGLPKTGTKYLQHNFYRLREQLRARGVYYPTEWWPEHPIFAHHGLAEDLREVPSSRIAGMFAQFNTCGSDTVLLSSEGFNPVPQQGLEYLRDLAQGAKVEIVFYARRWSDWLPSQWQQAVKQGSIATFSEWLGSLLADAERQPGINQALFLDRFARTFGRDSIRLMSYSNLMDHNVDIFENFCNSVLNLSDLVPSGGSNLVHESMGLFLTELIRCLNARQAMGGRQPGYHVFSGWERISKDAAVAAAAKTVFAAMEGSVAELLIDDNASLFQVPYARLDEYRDRLLNPELGGGVFTRHSRNCRYVRTDFLLQHDVAEAVGRICHALNQHLDDAARIAAK